jgi:hypothetical protein
MADIAIHVENLSKRYRIGARQKRANTLRETLGNLVASPFDCLRSTLRGPPSMVRHEYTYAQDRAQGEALTLADGIVNVSWLSAIFRCPREYETWERRSGRD